MNSNEERILLIEGCNFEDYPTGGHLSFAKHMLQSFGNDLVLVGISTGDVPVGVWTKKTIKGITYDYFAYQRVEKTSKRPLIPARLKNFYFIFKQRKKIKSFGIENVFVQTFDSYLAIYKSGFRNICYRFPGLENQLEISRYLYIRVLSSLFFKFFLPTLQYANLILASADNNKINDFIHKNKPYLPKKKILQFPTRVDTSIFRKRKKHSERLFLNIQKEELIIVTTGRLGWFKGWKFMIDAFRRFKKYHKNASFYFIGDGEDKNKIREYIKTNSLEECIHILGFQSQEIIAKYLNAADLFIMGSYHEGWSTSLVEAIACGVPSCVTNFSSAKDIITEGKDGFIADRHDELLFAKLMNKALLIERKSLPDQSKILKYSTANLKEDLMKLWELK